MRPKYKKLRNFNFMSKFYKFAGWIASFLLIPGSLYAKPVTPSEALDRVAAKQTAGMKKLPARTTTALAHTFNAESGTPMLYAFNKGENEGYLITPADDSFPAVIGYGDNGTFDVEKIPSSMKWFIEEFAREMDFALTHNADALKAAAAVSNDWTPVEPLLKSKWDQAEPYNQNCPDLVLIDTTTGDPTGQTIPTVTGCVATSMAQVMYYHKWPDVGVGSNKYEWKTYSDVQAKTLEFDFSKYQPDWNNMIDVYTTNKYGAAAWTSAQAKAVADLMYACGISVNMLYNMAAAGGSGAYSQDQCTALVNHFKYSKGIRYKYRDFCNSWEFEQIIYNDLKKGLPVLYSGRSTAGGHSFVCDGYAGDHYFHFNWGWSGVSDGYFYLARLNPDELGTGASASGFNTTQGISYNIVPVKDGVDTGTEEEPYINCVGNFNYYSRALQKATTGEQLMFTNFKCENPISGYNAGFWNMSSVTFTGYFGLVVEKTSGSMQPEFIPCVQADKLAASSGVNTITAYLEAYPEGTYKISPAIYNSITKKFDDIHVANGYHSYVTMTVDAEGNRTFKNQDYADEVATAPEMAVTCFNYKGDIASNVNHEFLISVANYNENQDYYGDLTMLLKNASGKVLATLPLGTYHVPAGLAIPGTFSLAFDILKGSYTVAFRDAYGRELPGEFPLKIAKKGSALTTQLRVMAFGPTDVLPKSTISKVTFQVGNYGSTAVTNPKFYFVWNKMGETAQKSVYAQYNVTLNSNTYVNFQLSSIPFNFDEGIYELKVCVPASATDATLVPISQTIYMRAGNPVETVTLDNENASEIGVGETKNFKANLTPANATFTTLNWSSSNPEVATVDSEGNVTGISKGHTYISSTAYNGATDSMLVNVSESSSVDELASDDAIIAVYNVNGVLLHSNPSPSDIDSLDKGIYLVKTASGTKKITR